MSTQPHPDYVLSTDPHIPAAIREQMDKLRTDRRIASELYADMDRQWQSVHEWTPAPTPKPPVSNACIFWQFVGMCGFLLVTASALLMWGAR